MTFHYLIGVITGLLSGALIQGGQLLQKKAVNQVRAVSKQRFIIRLIKNRTWLAGFVVVGGGSASYALAQSLIGPALVPGLTAFGLIVLAIGSVKMNHEDLGRAEIVGIFLMITGVFLLGLSKLDIPLERVHATLRDGQALFRMGVYTGAFIILFIFFRSLVTVMKHHQGIFIALGNGFLACLNNFWVTPMLAVILLFLSGKSLTSSHWIIFIVSALLVTILGWVITWQSQVAFKVAQASNVIPVGQVPVQLAPIVVYFFVFALSAPGFQSIIYIISGTVLTITAGFLLGKRQQILVD